LRDVAGKPPSDEELRQLRGKKIHEDEYGKLSNRLRRKMLMDMASSFPC